MASFFVSRVDTETDKRLDAIGTDEAKALKGKAAVANARLAYQAYEEVFSSDRWNALDKAHANKQRPLWASTGVKDPSLKDTMYVEELVAPNTVNTMPEATLEATADHGEISGDKVRGSYEQAQADLDALAKIGISYDDVVQVLEDEASRSSRRPGTTCSSPLRRSSSASLLRRADPPCPAAIRCVTPRTDGSRVSRGRRAWSSSASRAICPVKS